MQIPLYVITLMIRNKKIEEKVLPGSNLERSDQGRMRATTARLYLSRPDLTLVSRKKAAGIVGSLFLIGLEVAEFCKILGREMVSLWLWRKARELCVESIK